MQFGKVLIFFFIFSENVIKPTLQTSNKVAKFLENFVIKYENYLLEKFKVGNMPGTMSSHKKQTAA